MIRPLSAEIAFCAQIALFCAGIVLLFDGDWLPGLLCALMWLFSTWEHEAITNALVQNVKDHERISVDVPDAAAPKTWKPCACATHPGNVAIVTSTFIYGPPEPWEREFVLANFGKLACFACGGQVRSEDLGGCKPDHVAAGIVTERLRKLGAI